MWKALLTKELRECGLYAGLALIVQMHFIGAAIGLPLFPMFFLGRGRQIPFLSAHYWQHERLTCFTTIAIILAIVVGLHQSMWESWRQTTLFLLHRPMPRVQIFLGKLAAGGSLVLAAAAIPLLIYSVWAATPGTHASPFFWGFTEPWWRSVMTALVCYFGAFLTGLRPAHWLGSRTWPLITAVLVALTLNSSEMWLMILKVSPAWIILTYIAFVVLSGLLVISILDTAQRREYP